MKKLFTLPGNMFLLFALLFSMTATFPLQGQDYVFKVLVNKGENKINKQPLKVGVTLNADDKIKVGRKGYLGLLHKSGRPLEIKKRGVYSVKDLEKKLLALPNDLILKKYVEFLLDEGQKKDYAFKVLVNKGENKINKQPLKVGGTLNTDDKIKVGSKGYLRLLHKTGRTLEIKKRGIYRVNDLERKLLALPNTSLPNK